MKIQFLGSGLWTRGMTSVGDLANLLHDPSHNLDAAFAAPKPESIPAKERRRAGLMINLAVEVAHQACEQAQLNKALVPSVFTSAMGDTAITDYMCRKLSGTEKLLSPTKFHNSVHNAPSGYWTISAQNRAPSSFVGGFEQSFGAALLEASSQACANATPVLLVASDIATGVPFEDILPVSETLGIALVVAPVALDLGPFQTAANVEVQATAPVFELRYNTGNGIRARSSQPLHPELVSRAEANPMGCALGLLERLQTSGAARSNLSFAAAPGALLELSVVGAKQT
ncbi:MAG: beta-ketoacyl synthase chain length factor [Pseudomonadales bacterium]